MSTTTEAPNESDSAPQLPSRARRVRVIGLIVLGIVVAYVLSILAFSASGRSNVVTQPNTLPRGASGINIGAFDLVGMDTVKTQMSLRLYLFPEGDFADVDNGTWAKGVRITTPLQTSGPIVKEIPKGQAIGGGIELTVFITGDPQTYPFDKYEFGAVYTPEDLELAPADFQQLFQQGDDGLVHGPQILFGAEQLGPDGKPVPNSPIQIGMDGPPRGLQGWTEEWSIYSSDSVMYVQAAIKRSGGVLAFVMVILLLMITIAVLALVVSTRVALKLRPIEATMASWFAALLFALIPLRTNMPGAPPIGAWIDVTVFFWVEAALLVAMSIFIVSWLRYRKPPVDD